MNNETFPLRIRLTSSGLFGKGSIDIFAVVENHKIDDTMIISAKNQLKGKVVKITDGVVNSEVVIELAPGVEITSIITKTSVSNLKLSIGKEAYAVIKASNVMVGVAHE